MNYSKSLHYATKIYPFQKSYDLESYTLTSSLVNFSQQSLPQPSFQIMDNPELGSTVDMSIDALYPAVIECFSVILLGFIAGKTGIVSPTETKGFNTFIGTFSLPALIFISMAQLDLSVVNWTFLLAILLSKTTVFFTVLFISLLVSRRLDKSGIFAIFCTQSNDFALGYPIVYALYGKVYASYLYLVAPVNLMILNPIAFTLIEISRQRTLRLATNATLPPSNFSIFRKVGTSVVLNPIVLMTLLGICANLIFSHELPETLGGILNMLGSAFSSCALFMLGITMVGSSGSLRGSGFVVPGILISVKLLALPLVTREFVSLLNAGNVPNETVSLSNYGFLYGTFPTAPGVFVYAVHYDIMVEMIAGAMVASTFLAAPLMFISAKMITLRNLDPKDYLPDLDSYLFHVSIIGLFSSIWVVVIFVLSRKWKKVPHCITLCLFISQGIACVGAIFWSLFGVQFNGKAALYVQFFIFSFGVLSSRIWTAILSASLVFLRCRSFCLVLRLRGWMALVGWGIPGALTTLLLVAVRSEMLDEKQNPNFQYGESQALVASMVLLISFIVTVGCLVMQQRYERKYGDYSNVSHPPSQQTPSTSTSGTSIENITQNTTEVRDIESLDPTNKTTVCTSLNCGNCLPSDSLRKKLSSSSSTSSSACRGISVESSLNSDYKSRTTNAFTKSSNVFKRSRNCSGVLSEVEEGSSVERSDEEEEESEDEKSLFSYSEDLCSVSKFGCDVEQRKHCRLLLQRYKNMNQLTEPEEIGITRDRDDEFQMLRHIVLLLLLCASMFVGIALCLWTLIMEDLSGIYVELVFLDTTLNFGQGFISFMLFGLNTKMILIPAQKWLRKLWYGEGYFYLPKWDELSTDTKNVCEQFLNYHYDKCVQDIVRDRRWRLEEFTNVFCGHELVDWLLLVGLARDRNEGVKYGKHLLNGRVIRHVKDIHHFHDQPFFYTFSPPPP